MTAKKRTAMAVCLCVALAVFSVTAVAQVANISGYERLKNAAFAALEKMNLLSVDAANYMSYGVAPDAVSSILFMDESMNATYEGRMAFSVDGHELTSVAITGELDGTAPAAHVEAQVDSMEVTEFTYTDGVRDFDGPIYSEHNEVYLFKDELLARDGDSDFNRTEIKNYDKVKAEREAAEAEGGQTRYGAAAGQALTETQKRFVSALIDAVVGEAKNYVVSEGDTVYATLNEYQVPELFQLGLGAFAELEDIQYYTAVGEPLAIGPDARFSLAEFSATLNPDDSLKDFSARVEITSTEDGAPKVHAMAVSMAVKDEGGTVITRPPDDQINDWYNGAFDLDWRYGAGAYASGYAPGMVATSVAVDSFGMKTSVELEEDGTVIISGKVNAVLEGGWVDEETGEIFVSLPGTDGYVDIALDADFTAEELELIEANSIGAAAIRPDRVEAIEAAAAEEAVEAGATEAAAAED